MIRGLVSIVVPCFNVGKTFGRYLESILTQTYQNIEIIIVDDGSTDDTQEVFEKYKIKFRDRRIGYKYIYQENRGLGGAINTGIKEVSGEYLCWSDPDDFYYSESIRKRVEIFEKFPEFDVVSSDAYVFDESDLIHPLHREAERFEHRFEENQFELLLHEKSHFCAGCHMVRMEKFDLVNPERTIYEARRGQNWQMLLPMYYQGKRYYLDEPLYGYVLYSSSMSSGDVTEERELFRWDEHEEIIMQTLKRIDMSESKRTEYEKQISNRYTEKRFYTAIDYRDKNLLKEQYTTIKNKNINNSQFHKLYLRNRYIFFKVMFKIIEIFKRR